MTNLIDVHILHLPDENQEWWNLCKESLKGHPINVHNLDGEMGDMYGGRCRGYNTGSAPYVSFVDPDDLVMPGSFRACADVLESGPEVSAICTNSELINKHGEVRRKWIKQNHPWIPDRHYIHQLAVVRRSVINEAIELAGKLVEEHDAYADYIIFGYVGMITSWNYLPIIGYQWRIHGAGYHKKLNTDLRKEIHEMVYEQITS